VTGTSPGSDLVLSVDRVSKRFCRDFRRSLRYGLRDIASELLGRRRPVESLRTGEFWALRDVSLGVRRGEAVGLIGPNGAGKTTLLRLISGLINPDRGSLTVRGRVAPLISLGVGFNPVLTGAENIFVIMTILGLTKKEIDRRFAEVVDFAEIGDALQAPVQTYSWGMTARLGFACAVHAAPDILVIDEVLAVGDSRFRVKCYRRLAAMRDAGAAFVLVSHNPLAILSVCDSATYLSAGRVLVQGAPRSVVARYEEEMAGNGAAIPDGAAAAARSVPDGYTLLMAPSPTMAAAVTIYKNLPYDPVTDFVPIALAAQTPFALVVNPSQPIHTVADLIRLAKEKPGHFSYGSAGPGTPHHLFAELFKGMTGIEMSHVPYRGSGPLLNDIVGGHLPVTFVDFPPAVGVLQTGKIRPIGISTRSRLASFPAIPPVADTVPGFDAASWQMLVAPAKTPRPIVDKVNGILVDYLKRPDTNDKLQAVAIDVLTSTPDELAAFIPAEIAKWAQVVKDAGIVPE